MSERTDYRRIWIILVLLAVYLCFAALLFIFFSKTARFIFPFFNGAWPLYNLVVSRRKKRTAIVGEGPIDSVWVRMEVQSFNGVATGIDHGWLLSCDGWLLFEGSRTNFAFTRGVARQLRYEVLGHLFLEDDRRVAFSVVGEMPDPKPLQEILRSWERAPIPDGEAVLPPRESHPQIWSDRSTYCVLGGLICLVPSLLCFWAGFPIVGGGFLLGAVASVSGSIFYARRLRSELKRLLPLEGARRPPMVAPQET